MKRLVRPLALFLLAALGCHATPSEKPFDRARLERHVRYLSSERLAGREAGSPGARAAARYVADRFAEIGLERPPGGAYEIPFPAPPGAKLGADTLRNVVGLLGGGRSGKALLLGAHYDHLGVREGRIHPGADDNASGVALLIELARLFARESPYDGPVVFAAFTAEEEGLVGSRRYCAAPAWPLGETAAMVNIDMVGRLGEKSLLYAASGVGDAKREALRQEIEGRIDAVEMRSGFEAGDLASFAAARLPGLMFFTGAHADYHRPTDTEEKIDYDGLARVGRVIATAAPFFARLAGGLFEGAPPPSSVPPPAGSERPYLGTVPDFTAPSGAGVVVSDVVPGSPAEKATIRAGDRVVALDGEPIAGLRDYATLLRARRVGDTVRIGIVRGGEKIEIEAVLGRKSGSAPSHGHGG